MKNTQKTALLEISTMALLPSLEHNRHSVLKLQNSMHSANESPASPWLSDRGFEYGVKHILSPQSGLLSDVLLSILQTTPEQIAELLHLGSIYYEGHRLRGDRQIQEGDYLRVHTKPRRFPSEITDWSECILFQNEDILVACKPWGMPVHPSVDNVLENLQYRLSQQLQQELFVTHRLDVPTQGLLVYAKTKLFLADFNQLLADRQIRKFYRALCRGPALRPGLYTHFMEPSPRAPKKVSTEAAPGWQECQLQILDVQPTENAQEVKIELLTGRTHQIRAQLAALQNPICGDELYGAPRKYEGPVGTRIDLAAEELRFMDFQLILPPKFRLF